MNRTLLLGPLAAAASLPATAQFTTQATVTYSLTWEEAEGNANGLLEPGESARVRLNTSFSPAVNTAIQYTPAGGGVATGTVRGFGAGVFDCWFQDAGGGSFITTGQTGGIPNGRAAAWSVVPGGNGTVVGERIMIIEPAQFPFNSLDHDPVLNPQGVRTDNPVESIYIAVWTPASYTPRTVRVQMERPLADWPPAVLCLRTNADPNLPPTAVATLFSFGSVNIPVVPAPGSATAAIAAAGALAARRRRTWPQTEGGVGVLLKLSPDPLLPPSHVWCLSQLGSVSIPVVPSPGVLSGAGAAVLLSGRRRRCR